MGLNINLPWQYKNNQLIDGKPNWKINDLAYQQFTGLKDLDGTDVFEGDIVKCNFNTRQDMECFGVVEFCDKYGSLEILVYSAEMHINAKETPKPFFNFFTNDGKFLCKVVGNIFENPELLA